MLALRDLDDQARVSAASRLGYTGRVDAVAPLVTLAADRAPRTRSMAAYARGRLGSNEAAPDRHRQALRRQALASPPLGTPTSLDLSAQLTAESAPVVGSSGSGLTCWWPGRPVQARLPSRSL
ncbi:HEAT repeat domain-containing protein [Micromonospora sp. NPDC047465]|uniref:HEAT repeat domain-containing protein n=1 Tax=Micromonospora sp. NPDC047465 TaxID=3154813 RepID=UPI0033DE9699